MCIQHLVHIPGSANDVSLRRHVKHVSCVQLILTKYLGHQHGSSLQQCCDLLIELIPAPKVETTIPIMNYVLSSVNIIIQELLAVSKTDDM